VNQIVVMIPNQSTSADYEYTVRLESGVIPGGGNPLKINIDAGKAVTYNSSEPLTRESTVMLVFNGAGALQRRYVYSLEHARGDDPPTEYICPSC